MLQRASVTTRKIDERYMRFRELPWSAVKSSKPFRIGFIGSLARLYKSPDVVLRAAAACQHRGLNFHVTMVGEGRHLAEMKVLATSLGIMDRVQFLGQLSLNSILELLDSIDLFVIPSRAEGLPRALLEAMSRGCPCIGSAVGGIPELLDPEDLVPVGNKESLAESILRVAFEPGRLIAMSMRNQMKAQQFAPETLRQHRYSFLETIKLRSKNL